MSVLGNALMVGVKKPRILVAVIGQTTATSMSSLTSVSFAVNDSQYFSAGSDYSHYVCKRAGTYTIRVCTRSVYASGSSTRTNGRARVYIGSSYGSREITSSANTYETADYSVTLSVGDTVGLNATTSTNNIYVPVNMLIVQTQ